LSKRLTSFVKLMFKNSISGLLVEPRSLSMFTHGVFQAPITERGYIGLTGFMALWHLTANQDPSKAIPE
jgi:hypothetical protein